MENLLNYTFFLENILEFDILTFLYSILDASDWKNCDNLEENFLGKSADWT